MSDVKIISLYSGSTGNATLIATKSTAILIDAGKAILACTATGMLLQPYCGYTAGAALGGLAVMMGHNFPALLGFKGGKGILSGLFIALSIDWRIALILLVVFFGAYLLTQYVSLGSVLAAAAFGISAIVLYWQEPIVMVCGVLMGAMAIYMHRGNIQRLLKGQERKTNLFAKGEKK